MVLISLKCPECHGDIQLDDTREFGFCMHCGTKVLLRNTAKQNLNITLEDNRIANSESTFNFALNLWLQSDFDKASSNVEDYLKIQPDSMKGWILYWIINDRPCERSLLPTLKFDESADIPVLKTISAKYPMAVKLYRQCFYDRPSVLNSLVHSNSTKFVRGDHKTVSVKVVIDSDNLADGFCKELDRIIDNIRKNDSDEIDIEECETLKSAIICEQTIEFRHKMKKAQPVSHYFNGNKYPDGPLANGELSMQLEVGMHEFRNENKNKSLYLPIPAIPPVGMYYYTCNLGATEPTFEFKHWHSGVDTVKVCTFRLAEPFSNWTVIVKINSLGRY